MNVAVPLLQHSQWFGHLALSQTVCSRRSSSRLRVFPNVFSVGNRRRSHSGMRGLSLGGNETLELILRFLRLELAPEFLELIRAEVGQDFAVNIDHRRQSLSR